MSDTDLARRSLRVLITFLRLLCKFVWNPGGNRLLVRYFNGPLGKCEGAGWIHLGRIVSISMFLETQQ